MRFSKNTTVQQKILRALLTIVAMLVALMFFLPFIWMLASAFRPQDEIFRYLSPLSPHILIPVQFTTEHFVNLFNSNFLQATVNSIVVCILTEIIGLSICAFAAFALSALKFRFREAIFAFIVVCSLIPFDVIALPLSDIFRAWQLQDSFAGLVLPGIANGMAIFLLRQFFLGIPVELKEAAQMDGANWWSIFYRMYLPLSRPALIAAGLILFTFQWQSFLWPLLIVSDPAMQVAPITLASFFGQYVFDFGKVFAGSLVLAIIPILVLLPLQRYFTQSIAATGGKS